MEESGVGTFNDFQHEIQLLIAIRKILGFRLDDLADVAAYRQHVSRLFQ